MKVELDNNTEGINRLSFKKDNKVIIKMKKVGNKIRLELDLNIWTEMEQEEGITDTVFKNCFIAPMIANIQYVIQEMAHGGARYIAVDEDEKEYHEN